MVMLVMVKYYVFVYRYSIDLSVLVLISTLLRPRNIVDFGGCLFNLSPASFCFL